MDGVNASQGCGAGSPVFFNGGLNVAWRIDWVWVRFLSVLDSSVVIGVVLHPIKEGTAAMVSLSTHQNHYRLSDDARHLSGLVGIGAVKERLWKWNGLFVTPAQLARIALELSSGELEKAMNVMDEWVCVPQHMTTWWSTFDVLKHWD